MWQSKVVLSFIDLLSLSIEISLLNERVRVMILNTIMVLTELRRKSCSTWLHVEQELLILPEHPSSYHVFSGVLDARF